MVQLQRGNAQRNEEEMIMRKKLITLGLIFAMGASLTACGSNSGSSSASASSGATAVSSA
jgi:hypothetical protein